MLTGGVPTEGAPGQVVPYLFDAQEEGPATKAGGHGAPKVVRETLGNFLVGDNGERRECARAANLVGDAIVEGDVGVGEASVFSGGVVVKESEVFPVGAHAIHQLVENAELAARK